MTSTLSLIGVLLLNLLVVGQADAKPRRNLISNNPRVQNPFLFEKLCRSIVESDRNKISVSIDVLTPKSSRDKLQKIFDEALRKPSFSTLNDLLQSFNPVTGVTEPMKELFWNKVNAFLAVLSQSKPFEVTYKHLWDSSKFRGSKEELISKFKSMWFTPSSKVSVNDSSGFEHVFAGDLEMKKGNTNVGGLHSWFAFLRMLIKDKISDVKILKRALNPKLPVVTKSFKVRHESRTYSKPIGGFFVGLSPEAELSLFTSCALLDQDRTTSCSCVIDGSKINVKVVTSNSRIVTAYPIQP